MNYIDLSIKIAERHSGISDNHYYRNVNCTGRHILEQIEEKEPH